MVGCGPAGCAAAWSLARAGRRVLLAGERASGPRFGEVLPPEAAPLLARLEIAEPPGIPCAGIATAWGGRELRHREFLGSPYGQGWLLDREAFDDLLFERALEAGAEPLADRVASLAREHDRWRARVGVRDVRAGLLVDATGRPAAVARRLGVVSRRRDRLTAAGAWLRGPADDPDCTLTVESVPEGWWYTARVPGGRRIAVFLTDAGSQVAQPEPWLRLLERTVHVRERTLGRGWRLVGPLAVVSADTRTLPAPGGEGWIAVGDARMSWDPLSSRGLTGALRDGLDCLRAPDLPEHERQVESSVRAWREAYAQETRWPGEPFWRERYFSGT